MNLKKSGLAGLALVALVLSGCGSGDRDGLFDGIGPGGVPALSVTELANREINRNTSETAAPIELNDLFVDDDDVSDTTLPDPI